MDLTDSEDFPDHPDPVLQKRFPTNDVFFRYHSIKAKLRQHDPEWHDVLRFSSQLQEEIELEWIGMDMYTVGEWAELRARLLQGRRWYLRSDSASHLFKRGVARLIWRDGLGHERRERSVELPNQPVRREKRRSRADHSTLNSSNEEHQSRPPLPARSIFRPVKHKYPEIKHKKRTIFVRLPNGSSLKPFQIADACRSKAGSVQRNVCEDAHICSPDLCIVRLRRDNVARRLAGQYIRVGNGEMEVRPYPKFHPQTYVAQILHNDPNGLRADSLLYSVAEAFTKVPFHAWTRYIEDETLTVYVIAFQRPLKLLGFDTGVQTVGGLHVIAQFNAATKAGSCPVCRGSRHSILKCGLLEEVDLSEVPDRLKDGKYLYDAPEIA